MTAAWAKAHLPLTVDGATILAPGTTPVPDGALVVLITNPDGSVQQAIDPDVLATATQGAPDAPTHAALSDLPVSAGGYQQVWDAWKAAGYIA